MPSIKLVLKKISFSEVTKNYVFVIIICTVELVNMKSMINRAVAKCKISFFMPLKYVKS